MDESGVLPATREIVQTTGGGSGMEVTRPMGRNLTPTIVKETIEQVVLFREMRAGILKGTSNQDWIDQEGDPYLTDSGVMAVACAVGFEFGEPETERLEGTDAKGPFVTFRTKMSAFWPVMGRTYFDIGVASSRDPFFAKKKEKEVALGDVNLGNVEKKSITNVRHRLLTKALALDSFSWGDLKAMAGVLRPNERVRHRGYEGRSEGAGGWTEEKNAIWVKLMKMAYGEDDGAREQLRKMTANTSTGFEGFGDLAEMSNDWVAWLTKKLAPVYAEWETRNMPAGDGPPADVSPAAEPAKTTTAGSSVTPVQRAAPTGTPKQTEFDPRDDPERLGGR